ncbi:MAG: flagellar biosynthetic protein FliQ [Firmicutes bacterium]|jgi:flagellar biosynthetic protein FliQ|nr:flagellar biosynthetic protein FliQ [Bacillota bacterium]
MTNTEVMSIMQSALIVGVKLAAPILLLSMFLGILISIIQAATQIHEQTITFVPKLILIIALCLFSGNWMLETLQDYTFQLFQMMLL